MPERWFYGGPAGLQPGDVAGGHPVHVSPNMTTARAYVVIGGGALYEVQPLHAPWPERIPLSPDSDPRGNFKSAFICNAARVLRVCEHVPSLEQSFYHGGTAGLQKGHLLTPSTWRPNDPSPWPDRRLSEVYITTSPSTARLFARGHGWIYIVRPLEVQHYFADEFACVVAIVLGVHEKGLEHEANEEHEHEEHEHENENENENEEHALAKQLFRSLEHVAREGHGTEGIHGPEHWRRVLANGLRVARATPEADPLVIAAFAALHDAYRLNDGDDPEHGSRAARHARALEGVLSPEQLDTLCAALEEHDRGATTEHPTIGACWDADRLDLPRVGIEVDPRFLSTPFALALHGNGRRVTEVST
jgi:uncharacterized protein